MKEKHQHPENYTDQGHEVTFDSNEPVGSFLKRTRLSQHKTIEDVAGITRIHSSTLKYIEEGVMDKLPAEVFVRGFIKLYARHLGLDPDETISTYIQQNAGGPHLSKDKINAREILSSETLAESPFLPGLRTLFILAILVLLGLLAYWGYSAYKIKTKTTGGYAPAFSNSSSPSAPPIEAERELGLSPGDSATDQADDSSADYTSPSSAGEKTAEGTSLNAGSQQAAASSAGPGVSATVPGRENLLPSATDGSLRSDAVKEKTSSSTPYRERFEPRAAGLDASTSGTGAELSVEEIIAAETTPPETPTLMISAEKQKKDLSTIQYTLEAKFDEITWLRIEIDNQRPREYTFGPGDQESWQAQKSMQLFVGNGGGVSLTMNGEDLGPIGPSGRPVKLSFPK